MAGFGTLRINFVGAISFQPAHGPQNFIAEDSARRHDNIATSGLRESVFEATDILIAFTMPGIRIGTDYANWKNFYAAALPGGSFLFTPNTQLTVAAAPWSGQEYFFACVLEDTGFRPKRTALGVYSLECKFRVVPDALAPANSGMIMEAFWGLAPL